MLLYKILHKGKRNIFERICSFFNVKGTDIDTELTGDIVGELLFADADFVNHLSVEHRNLFEYIFDQIKYFANLVTAGSKEARQIEVIKHRFENAYRAQKNTANNSGVQNSPSDVVTKNREEILSYSIDKYTQKQYNSFGWARDTEAITKNELDDMYSKIQIKGSLKKFPQSSYGEAIIEVDDKAQTTLRANNVMIFARGTKNNPEITRVVKFNIFEEDLLEDFRKDIYANNTTREIEAYARALGKEFVRYYDRSNSADFREYANKPRTQRGGSESKNNPYANQFGNQRNGAFAEAQSNEIAPIKEVSSTDDAFFDAEKQKNTANNSGVQYSISPTLNQDLDLVLNGKFAASKGEVYLGETSNFMTDVIGAESLKVTMPASKAYSAMVTLEEYEKNPHYDKQDHYHGIGKDDFIEILEKSENPIAAFAAPPDEDGNTRYNRIVLVTDKIIPDIINGGVGNAVVIEEVDTKGRFQGKQVRVNKTITVYPRAQIESDISQAIADGRILDIKTKKDQLSAGRRGSKPQATIRKTDLANNIAHFWANVKWENEKNKIFSAETTDGMTEMQAALMKAGLIDADGHIQYMQDSENDSSRKNSLSYTDEAYPIRGDFATPMSDIRYTAPMAEAAEDIAPLPASPVAEASAIAPTPSTPPGAPTTPKASGQPAKVANNILRAGMNFYNLINIENKKPVTFVTG